jgi:hypothetical protein
MVIFLIFSDKQMPYLFYDTYVYGGWFGQGTLSEG